MILINMSRVLAVIAVVIQLNLVFFLSFMFAVFGRFDLFLLFILVLNFALGALILKAELLTRRPTMLTGLEIMAYGLASLSSWFLIFNLARIPAGITVFAGGLYLAGAKLNGPFRQQYYR